MNITVKAMVEKRIRWGIIGLGRIAEKFANDLELVTDAELYAVASRSEEKANDFARKFKVTKAYKGYKKICEDENVDIVYIATPHHLHFQNSLDCLRMYKPVLCEKPAAINRKQLEEMISESKSNQTFFMEALWTRFLPFFSEIYKTIISGSLGEIISVRADFCFNTEFNPKSRLYDQNMGGGALLDIGIYPVFLAYQLMGVPQKISATAKIGKSQVDEVCTIIMEYEHGKSAQLLASIIFESRMEAEIHGTFGSIVVPPRWHESTEFSIVLNQRRTKRIQPGKIGKGYVHEITACHDCLRNRWIEHPDWSHKNSLELMGILDSIREEIGLRYPYD